LQAFNKFFGEAFEVMSGPFLTVLKFIQLIPGRRSLIAIAYFAVALLALRYISCT